MSWNIVHCMEKCHFTQRARWKQQVSVHDQNIYFRYSSILSLVSVFAAMEGLV